MAQQSIPASPTYRYSHYSGLMGIDLTSDVTQTPRNRAADILNMIPDIETGNPRKREGWRKLYDFGSGTVILGSRHIPEWNVDIIATNVGLFSHDSDEPDWELADLTEVISTEDDTWDSVAFIGFDSQGQYLVNIYNDFYALTYDNGTVSADTNAVYVPTTVISRDPDGSNGYAYEAVNAFTMLRKISFLSNYTADDYDSTKTYEVGDLCVYSDDLYKCTTAITTAEAWTAAHWTIVSYDFSFYPAADQDNHVVLEIIGVEARDSNGEWQDVTTYTPIVTGDTVDAYVDYNGDEVDSFSVTTGFTLSSRYAPAVPGQDNIRVTIAETSPEPNSSDIYPGMANPIVTSILKNNVAARYGMSSMDREFYSAQLGRVYYTDADNFGYLPDNNYIQLQVDAPIVGFHRKNTYLVAITGSSAEFTVFMIAGATTTITHRVYNENGVAESETEDFTYFIAKTAIAGTGAISRKSFATLVDDALFLSHRGVYGITSNTVTSETVVANRSELINPRMVDEPDMDQAVATVWQGMYLLSFPTRGHVYVLDSRNTHKNNGVSYGYECYYLDNIYATDFLSYNGNLFFGDITGHWCRFNTDISNYTAYEDDGVVGDDGNVTGGDAIHALYATCLDCDSFPHYLKTLNKRGTAIEMMQLPASGAKLSYSKDGQGAIEISNVVFGDRFVWTLVDFEDFSFDSGAGIRTFYPKKKIKKYKYLQFILESTEKDQNFGLIAITKTYFIGNFAKR